MVNFIYYLYMCDEYTTLLHNYRSETMFLTSSLFHTILPNVLSKSEYVSKLSPELFLHYLLFVLSLMAPKYQ